MSEDVLRIDPGYEGGSIEEWQRRTDEPEYRGISSSNRFGNWVVDVYAQQIYETDERLGVELRQRIQAALRAVDGVNSVSVRDRGSWEVTGTPSGKALTRAAAHVVDELADRLRADT